MSLFIRLATAFILLSATTGCISKKLRALDADVANSAALLIVADGGASATLNKNSFAALDKAQDLGAVAVEIDVTLSADGRLVVYRATDASANSATASSKSGTPKKSLERGRASPRKTKEREIDKYLLKNSGSRYGNRRTPKKKITPEARVVTLDDVFERYGLTYQYYLVLHGDSADGSVTPATVDSLFQNTVRVVKEYGVQDNVLITSPDYERLTTVHKSDPTVPLCYLISLPDVNAEIQRAVVLGFEQIGVRTNTVTADQVKRAASVKIKVFGYGLATDDEVIRAAKAGVVAIASPTPDVTAHAVEAASKIKY